MEILIYIFAFLAVSAVVGYLRTTQGRCSEEEFQSTLRRQGNTVLKYETDQEDDGIIHVRYRDKDYNLHVVTLKRTWFGIRKVDERIMRNYNQWLKNSGSQKPK